MQSQTRAGRTGQSLRSVKIVSRSVASLKENRGDVWLPDQTHVRDQRAGSPVRRTIRIRPLPDNRPWLGKRALKSDAHPSAKNQISSVGQDAGIKGLAAFEICPSAAGGACICAHEKSCDSMLLPGGEIPLPSARFCSCLHLNALQIHKTFPMMRTRSISSSDKKIGAYSLLSLKRTSFLGCFSIRLTMIVSSTPTA